MLDLQAYMDESGTHGGPAIVVGGYLGMARQWEKFESVWTPVLEREGLTAFHAADCTAKQGEFAGWEWERGDSVYRELISIINEHNLFAVAMAVVTSDFRGLVSPELQKETREYHLAMQMCFCQFARSLRGKVDSNELIAYVFEQQDEFAGRAREIFQRILTNEDGERSFRLRSIGYGDRVKFVQLQAADILVYEMYREMDRMLNRKGTKPNGAFEALRSHDDDVVLGFYDAEKLAELLAADSNGQKLAKGESGGITP